MGLVEIFKKQGGIKLLMQYWKGGALFTAIGEFLLLGKSRTALEILRLSATLKTKQKLERKYKEVLLDFDEKWKKQNCLESKSSNKVWICWFQGMESASELVRRCYQSVKENMSDCDIVVITSENMNDYVQFPDFIIEKWHKGQISHTHMTDLLRLELLIRYGGMWLDATVFCSEKNIPDYFFESDLFFYQCLKPGRDGHCSYISSWLMSAKTNNRILMTVRELLYKYWKDNNSMWDYFLLHDFMAMVLDYYQDDWKSIIPRDNATPHILLLRLFDKYDEQLWQAIKMQTPFHKLSYKFDKDKENLSDTYYDVLIRKGK